MMVKTKPNPKIHVDKLQTTLEKLGQLKEKPKSELNLRESIYYLREKLKSALKKGYSYQDLSEILAEQEILISAATLKQYLTEINKQSAARKKRIKSGKSQKSNSSESDSNSQNSSEDVTLSKDEPNQDLNPVESEQLKEVEPSYHLDSSSSSEIESSKNKSQRESSKSQTKTKGTSKSIKTKTKELSGSNQDLSSEFNQY